jgi:hypothetical protein
MSEKLAQKQCAARSPAYRTNIKAVKACATNGCQNECQSFIADQRLSTVLDGTKLTHASVSVNPSLISLRLQPQRERERGGSER